MTCSAILYEGDLRYQLREHGVAIRGFSTGWGVVGAEEVDEGEDDDPDDVYEVPVETGNLDSQGVFLGEGAVQVLAEEGHEPNHPTGDVGAVEAR